MRHFHVPFTFLPQIIYRYEHHLISYSLMTPPDYYLTHRSKQYQEQLNIPYHYINCVKNMYLILHISEKILDFDLQIILLI